MSLYPYQIWESLAILSLRNFITSWRKLLLRRQSSSREMCGYCLSINFPVCLLTSTTSGLVVCRLPIQFGGIWLLETMNLSCDKVPDTVPAVPVFWKLEASLQSGTASAQEAMEQQWDVRSSPNTTSTLIRSVPLWIIPLVTEIKLLGSRQLIVSLDVGVIRLPKTMVVVVQQQAIRRQRGR